MRLLVPPSDGQQELGAAINLVHAQYQYDGHRKKAATAAGKGKGSRSSAGTQDSKNLRHSCWLL